MLAIKQLETKAMLARMSELSARTVLILRDQSETDASTSSASDIRLVGLTLALLLWIWMVVFTILPSIYLMRWACLLVAEQLILLLGLEP